MTDPVLADVIERAIVAAAAVARTTGDLRQALGIVRKHPAAGQEGTLAWLVTHSIDSVLHDAQFHEAATWLLLDLGDPYASLAAIKDADGCSCTLPEEHLGHTF